MRVLTLNLKREAADMILSGEKKFEYRELRPGSSGRFCYLNESGETVGFKEFDAIKFLIGQHLPDMPHMLVKLKGLPDLEIMEDENGDEITYMHDGLEFVQAYLKYPLGKILECTYTPEAKN